ncbi:glycosyltransferase family 39 protein [Chloroflexota bacterium]
MGTTAQEEPSVLDYVKSLLTPWKGSPIPFPPAEPDEAGDGGDSIVDAPWSDGQSGSQALVESETHSQPQAISAADELAGLEGAAYGGTAAAQAPAATLTWPWRALISLPLALAAQWAFAPIDRQANTGWGFLLIMAILAIWGYKTGELRPANIPGVEKKNDTFKVQPVALVAGIILAVLAFLTSGGGEFNGLNLGLLFLSLFFLLLAFWNPSPARQGQRRKLLQGLGSPRWRTHITRWGLLLLVSTAVILFFRFYQLGQTPPEMVSDHAEKYLDVNLILNGQPLIFFPRNGGREALQFYLLAAMNGALGLPQDHLTLKISTALVGLLALPFLYLAGLETGSRRAAWIAMTFAGMAYWTNVVSRAGMRLPFYMLFSAATIYFLLRALRTGSRNSFFVSGLCLGLGLYGYSADRILPLVVVVAIGLYLVHGQSKGVRKQTTWQTLLLVLMAFVVFLPLLRYMIMDPMGFSGRMLSRLSGTEQPLPGPALEIFLDNLRRALLMFSFSNGVVWGVSIPDYPALNTIAGGAYYLGGIIVLARYIHKRHWLDLFILISIPLLMLPSIMSLAFPAENPNLYRTGGAFVPVFLLVGIALDSLMSGVQKYLRKFGTALAWMILAALLVISAIQDYDLVFNKYTQQYRLSAWNYTEMGQAISDFSQTIGNPDNVWLMGAPHWADTRLVAITAGYPERQYAMFVDQLDTTALNPGPKLFLVKPSDGEAIEALSQVYPDGWFQVYKSKVESKDFLMFFVPPE